MGSLGCKFYDTKAIHAKSGITKSMTIRQMACLPLPGFYASTMLGSFSRLEDILLPVLLMSDTIHKGCIVLRPLGIGSQHLSSFVSILKCFCILRCTKCGASTPMDTNTYMSITYTHSLYLYIYIYIYIWGPSVIACLKLMNSGNLLNRAIGKLEPRKAVDCTATGQHNYCEFRRCMVFRLWCRRTSCSF